MFLISLALAHVPHEMVHFLAVPLDLDTSVPWILATEDEGVSLLYRSDDGGRSWVSMAPSPDLLVGAGYTESGWYVTASADRYFRSVSGEVWQEAPTPISANGFAVGEELYFWGEAGVYAGPLNGPFAPILTGVTILEVRPGLMGSVALGMHALYLRTETGWEEHPLPHEEQVTDAVFDGTTLYGGLADGTVWRRDDTWVRCGDVPGEGSIARLAADDTHILVMRGTTGPALSRDGCATWSTVPVSLGLIIGGPAGAASDIDATRHLRIVDDHLLIAGFDGAAVSVDGGASWTHPTIMGPDLTRGLVATPDGQLLLGSYGSGVLATASGGASFYAVDNGLDEANIQDVALHGSRRYALVNHVLYVAEQGPWIKGSLASTQLLDTGPGQRLWALHVDANPGGLAFSPDGARSFQSVPLPETPTVRAVLDLSPLVYVAQGDTIRISEDDGKSFEKTLQVGSEVHALAWGASGLVIAANDGLYLGPDQLTQTYAANGDEVLRLALAADGTGYAATVTGRLLRSDDGGATWQRLSASLNAYPYVLTPVQDSLLIATSDGNFRLSGDALTRWDAYQRIDDNTDFNGCRECPPTPWPDATLGTVTMMSEATPFRMRLRGHTIKVRGPTTAASGRLRIDGEERTFTVDGNGNIGLLFSWEGLPDTWHEVELSGEGLMVDSIEAYGEGDPLPVEEDTGCGGGVLWLVGLAGLKRYRPTGGSRIN